MAFLGDAIAQYFAVTSAQYGIGKEFCPLMPNAARGVLSGFIKLKPALLFEALVDSVDHKGRELKL
jgi:hypothetical protein